MVVLYSRPYKACVRKCIRNWYSLFPWVVLGQPRSRRDPNYDATGRFLGKVLEGDTLDVHVATDLRSVRMYRGLGLVYDGAF